MDLDNTNSEGRKLPKAVRVLNLENTNRRRFLKTIGATITTGLAFSGTAAADEDEDDEDEDDEDEDDEDEDDDDEDEDDDD